MICIASIAGFDSSGGAGISIDENTIIDLGFNPYLVQTAFTNQTHHVVVSIDPTPTDELKNNLAALNTLPIQAIKIGMLVNEPICKRIYHYLQNVTVPIILDPVLAASSGGLLLDKMALPFFKKFLMQQATLLTPNIPEAAILLNKTIRSNQDVEQAAQQFIQLGVPAVLIKGGHTIDSSKCADYLLQQNGVGQWFTSSRLASSMRGTGCRLSTAIACYMAAGNSLQLAIKKAKKLVYNLLKAL